MRFDYLGAPMDLVHRVRRLETVCVRYKEPLRAAAARFPPWDPSPVGFICD